MPKKTYLLLKGLLLGAHLHKDLRSSYVPPRGPSLFRSIVSCPAHDRHALFDLVYKQKLTLKQANKQVSQDIILE